LHARPAVGDLPPHLRLVDELGLQDAPDGLIRGGFRRRPRLRAREVRAQIGARRFRGRLTPEHDGGDEDEGTSVGGHGVPRNRRTPVKNTASRS
jgi:hypothetical protein